MKRNVLLFRVAVLAIILLLLCVWYFRISDARPPNITFNRNYTQYQEYAASYTNSTSQYDIGEIIYPVVNTRLNSSYYWLAMLKEKLDLYNDKYDNSFFAAKRINELKLWGNDIPVRRAIQVDSNSDRSIYNSIEKYWNDTKLRFKTEDNESVYNSWEAGLSRYTGLINNLFQDRVVLEPQARGIRLTELKRQLIVDRESIEITIAATTKKREEKAYLTRLSKAMYDVLLNKVSPYIPETDATTAIYPLPQLQQDREYGIYDIETEIPDDLTDTLITIKTKGGEYKVSYLDRFNFSGNRVASFRNVPLDTRDRSVTLHFPESNLLESSSWRHSSSNAASFSYILDLPSLEIPRRYFLEVTYQIDLPVDIQYEQKARVKDSSDIKILKGFRTTLLPSTEKKVFKRSIDYGGSASYVDNTVAIHSPTELSEEQLSRVHINLRPAIAPDIKLTKKDRLPDTRPEVSVQKSIHNTYVVNVKNTTKTEDEHIRAVLTREWRIKATEITGLNSYRLTIFFIPHVAFLITIPVVLIFLLISGYQFVVVSCNLRHPPVIQALIDKHLPASRNYLSKTSSHLILFLIRMCENLRYQLLVVAALFLFVDIFVIWAKIDFITYPLLLLWLLVTIGFRADYKIHFVTAGFFLVIAFLLLSIGAPLRADKAGLWTYIMILVGFIQSLLFYRLREEELMDYSTFFNHIFLNKMNTYTSHYRKICIVWFTLLIRRIRAYFSLILRHNPQSMGDYAYNYSVIIGHIVLIIAVLFLSFHTAIFAYRVYKEKRHEMLRKSLNPTITKIQPTLVYRTTKVMLTGKGFDWKDNADYRLMSSNGEIQTDYWGNPKIVFTVPIDWKPGTVSVWVEKPILWDGQTIMASGSGVQLKVLPVNDTFSPDDDAYFEQLKHLDPEVLKLNGYSVDN